MGVPLITTAAMRHNPAVDILPEAARAVDMART
jgi:hypothetical protein